MNLVITEIIPMGYGNPNSTISYDKQIESGELKPEVAARSREIIASGECMHPVTDNDDGCIDGRPAEEVLYVDEKGNFYTKPIEDAAEHIREKVAGGGYITGYAMYTGLGRKGASLDEDFHDVGKITNSKKLCCGAHTASGSHGATTGCGANDKVGEILANGIVFKEQIAKNTRALLEAGGVSFDETVFTTIIGNWQATIEDEAYFDASTGAQRFNAIQDNIKEAQAADGGTKAVSVSKNLVGSHNEDFIVVSYVEGYSFSQAHFTKALAESFPENPIEKSAQVFAIDVPRIIKLAKAIGGDDEQQVNAALYAGVAYQLATAATLTDGSLPIFLVKES